MGAEASAAVVWVREAGGHPWDYAGPLPVLAGPRLTLTLVALEEAAAVRGLGRAVAALAATHPALIRWASWGGTLADRAVNRLRARRFREAFAQPLPGFADPYPIAPAETGPVTQAQRLVPPFSAAHAAYLGAYRSVLLILARDPDLGPAGVQRALAPYAGGVDGWAVGSICAVDPEWVVVRCCTQCGPQVWQVFGPTAALAGLADWAAGQGLPLVGGYEAALRALTGRPD